jgi:ornithine cyclodeaminase/alanine dehydrogenase-like protein (mu-crystallin family)
VPLYLSEDDVDALLSPADAVAAIERCFHRLARGSVENRPRSRIALDGGLHHTMTAADLELGVCGVKTYTTFRDATFRDGTAVVLALFAVERPELLAIVEARRLGQRRTGAASAVAARHLARPRSTSLGVIGCGWQAEGQVECIRAAVPGIERVVAYCRDEDRKLEFCRRIGAEPAEYNRDAAEQDIVVTVTSSRDPVLRGEWLVPGALVCAVGANRRESRELDNAVLERASFVCCDSREQARMEAGDLVEPIERGVLDWLEVHELAEVVADGVPGRQDDRDIVVFKSLGIAAEDLAIGKLVVDRAREAGAGVSL